MGHRQSSIANWSMDDWAFGTATNAVQLEDVFVEAKKVPARYFGGQAIESDTSMHQMQSDLLSFDQALKQLFCFRRKKRKQPIEPEENYDPYQQYDGSDGHPSTIPEESEETPPSPPYINVKRLEIIEDVAPLSTTWRCRYCTAENKAKDIDCQDCKQTETRF